MSRESLKIGIIGASGYAGILIDCLDRLILSGEAHLAAAVIIDPADIPERVAELKSAGCRVYDDWREMLEAEKGKLDLCIIPTGIQFHKEMALAALNMKFTVFLEKPIAATMDDALAVVDAERSLNGRITMGFQDIYMPSTQRVKEVLVNGSIGTINSIRAIGLWPRNSDYYGRNDWAGSLKSNDYWVLDSPINNAFAHFVNLMLYWGSTEVGCSAKIAHLEAELYRARNIESFDTASLRIHTEDNVPIELHATHSCEDAYGPEIVIQGSEGSVRWLMEKQVEIETREGLELIKLKHSMEARRIMFAEVAKWLRGDPEAAYCSVRQALGHTLCVNLLHQGIPIYDVSQVSLHDDGKQPVVDGIADSFQRCLLNGGLLSENNTIWAKAPTSVEVPADWKTSLASYHDDLQSTIFSQ